MEVFEMKEDFSNLSIGIKLKKAFRIVVAFGTIICMISFIGLLIINTNYGSAIENYGFSQGDIAYVFAGVGAVDGSVHDAVYFLSEDKREAARQEYETQIETVNSFLTKLGTYKMKASDRALYEEALADWETYQQVAGEIIEASVGASEAQLQILEGKIITELEPIYTDMYMQLASVLVSTSNRGRSLRNTLNILAIVILFIMIIGIGANIWGSRVISKGLSDTIVAPIIDCSERLKLLAEGDLSSPIPEVTSEDESGQLAAATKTIVEGLSMIIRDEHYLLGEMAEGNFDIHTTAKEYYVGDFEAIITAIRKINRSLSKTLTDIQVTADAVAAAAGQMADASTALAEGSTDQASAVEEVLATVTEVTEQVGQNAKSATEASKRAVEIGKEADESNAQMTRMTEAMVRIDETSKQIATIVDSIDSISSQTSLLSLNASIEAARAGEAGRGFAVVAEEIRQLAAQSSEAANNTRSLIENALLEVKGGTSIAEETAESLQVVNKNIRKVVDIINAVREASDVQADSMHQMNDGINQISNVIQNNSATAEESSATSEELAAQAEQLNQMIAKFTLRKS